MSANCHKFKTPEDLWKQNKINIKNFKSYKWSGDPESSDMRSPGLCRHRLKPGRCRHQSRIPVYGQSAGHRCRPIYEDHGCDWGGYHCDTTWWGGGRIPLDQWLHCIQILRSTIRSESDCVAVAQSQFCLQRFQWCVLWHWSVNRRWLWLKKKLLIEDDLWQWSMNRRSLWQWSINRIW